MGLLSYDDTAEPFYGTLTHQYPEDFSLSPEGSCLSPGGNELDGPCARAAWCVSIPTVLFPYRPALSSAWHPAVRKPPQIQPGVFCHLPHLLPHFLALAWVAEQ